MKLDYDSVQFTSLILLVMISFLLSGFLIYSNINLSESVKSLRSGLESSPEFLFAENQTSGADGRYYITSSNIALYPKGNHPYKVSIDGHHEVGHYIWYEFLNNKLKNEYIDIYNKSNEYISDYAKTEVEEDFSETISNSIVISIDYDKIPEDRRDFVRNNLERFIVT